MFGQNFSYGRTTSIMNSGYPVVIWLMIINGIVFLLQMFLSLIDNESVMIHLALSNMIWRGEVWQLLTYMFLHADTWHLLFNMLALWMFGKELERIWGSREFLKYYLICGIGAGLTFLLFSNGYVIGASGGVFGILLAFGMTFPNQTVLFALIFPMKAKYMVMIFGVITFLSIASPGNDQIAHFAHLGGLVTGFIYLKRNIAKQFFRTESKKQQPPAHLKLHPTQKPENTDEELKRQVDRILDKINEVGFDKLTAEEQAILFSASHRLRKKADHSPQA